MAGPPSTETTTGLPAQLRATVSWARVTASLKVIEIAASSATLAAPLAGFVLATVGASSSTTALVRGSGAAAVKSAPFWSVSVAPPPARKAAVELVRVGAAAAPSKKFAVP